MDVLLGDRVLDVACGSGNTAIAAARYFAEVTGIDFVPALLERGRVRAAAELLEVEFVEGDAQELPFEELAWGTEERLRELFGSGISELRVERCVTTQRFRSPEHFLEVLLQPLRTRGRGVRAGGGGSGGGLCCGTEGGRPEIRTGGRTAAITADYVEVVAVRA
jgi:SAM-dependent methyltransferase